MSTEIKKVVSRVKDAQDKLQGFLKDPAWIEDARKYAERQGKEVKKLLSNDMSKVKVFLERERKELERFQKQIPGEVKKFRTFFESQRKELEKILAKVHKVGKTGLKRPKKKTKKTVRKRAAKKSSATVGA